MKLGTKHSPETLERIRAKARAQYHPTKQERLLAQKKALIIRNNIKKRRDHANSLRAQTERKAYEQVNPTLSEQLNWVNMGA